MTNEEKLKEIILSAYPKADVETIRNVIDPCKLLGYRDLCDKYENCDKHCNDWYKQQYIEPHKEYSMKEYQE